MTAYQGPFGRYCVPLFFFMSGYGLMTQYARKGKDAMMEGYLTKTTKLLLPLMEANLILYIQRGGDVTWQMVAENFRTGENMVRFAYFVEELAMFYLLLWVAYRFFSKGAALALCFMGTLCMMAVFRGLAWNPRWWISSLAFPLGMATVYMEKELVRFRLRYAAVTVALMLLAATLPNFTGLDDLQYKLLRYPFLLVSLACMIVYLLWPMVKERASKWAPLIFWAGFHMRCISSSGWSWTGGTVATCRRQICSRSWLRRLWGGVCGSLILSPSPASLRFFSRKRNRQVYSLDTARRVWHNAGAKSAKHHQ